MRKREGSSVKFRAGGLRSRILKLLKSLSLLMSMCAVGLLAYAWFKRPELRLDERVSEARAYLQKSVARILEIQNQMDPVLLPLLEAQGTARDAGPFLNPRVKWEGGAGAEFAIQRYRQSLGGSAPQGFSLPEDILRQVRSREAHCRTRVQCIRVAQTFDFNKVDLSWMSELKQFDHWDIEIGSPRALYSGPEVDAPVVDFMELTRHCARLRLFEGLQRHRLDAALGEVLHLARLIHSTETLLGAMASLAVIQDALSFSRLGLSAQKFERFKSDLVLARRAVFGRAMILHHELMDSSDFLNFVRSERSVGFCAALNEAGQKLLVTRPIFGPHFSRYSEFEKLLTSVSACRLKGLREQWAKEDSWEQELQSLRVLAHYPHARLRWVSALLGDHPLRDLGHEFFLLPQPGVPLADLKPQSSR